jgi:hypothetical protein
MITPEPIVAACRRFLGTCVTAKQEYYFIVKDFDRKVLYVITEEFDDAEYEVHRGELTGFQIQDYDFMVEECDRIKQEAAKTREEILTQLKLVGA